MSASTLLAAGLVLAAILYAFYAIPSRPAEPPLADPFGDRQVLPPAVRSAVSPDGGYRLVLEAPGPRSARAILISQDPDRMIWEKDLPHEYGPRIGLVGPQGAVVLLDEWINVVTVLAISVFRPDGSPLAVYSTDEVAGVLGVPRRALIEQATFGPWMRGTPELAAAGDYVAVPMGAQELRIDLQNGSLAAGRRR